jgi:1,4-alpha-glucan branching enzyme
MLDDADAFGPLVGDDDLHYFGEGTHLRPYTFLGAHPLRAQGVDGVRFVSVVGDFNGWDGRRHPMRWRVECGVWEIFLPDVAPGATATSSRSSTPTVSTCSRPTLTRVAARGGPATAAVVCSAAHADAAHRCRRPRTRCTRRSRSTRCMRAPGADPQDADAGLGRAGRTLVPYAAELGFTHIELLPVSEHPFDGSWGYQPTGMYAPTARFGTPRRCAVSSGPPRAGLGVILDWVPAHFPSDAHGLARTSTARALYEYMPTRARASISDWNTLIYNFGRTRCATSCRQRAVLDRAVRRRRLRVDAVASMLYRDYSRKAGEWVPNRTAAARTSRPSTSCAAANDIVHREARGDHDGRGVHRVSRRHRARGRTAAWASTTSGTWAG